MTVAVIGECHARVPGSSRDLSSKESHHNAAQRHFSAPAANELGPVNSSAPSSRAEPTIVASSIPTEAAGRGRELPTTRATTRTLPTRGPKGAQRPPGRSGVAEEQTAWYWIWMERLSTSLRNREVDRWLLKRALAAGRRASSRVAPVSRMVIGDGADLPVDYQAAGPCPVSQDPETA